MNEQLGRLKEKQQERARDVLRELLVRGVRMIGKDKIQLLEQSDQDLDYESIMAFYTKVMQKDREAFELNKTKKTNDVEIWTRARKEEEKLAMEKYCQEHGQEEITQIQKAIADRHAKELQTKVNLQSAHGAFGAYMEKMMVQRKEQLTEKQREFVNTIASEVKEVIMKNAEAVYKKNQIKILNAQAEERRRQ
mmetsp:Transcript_26161/g.32708  ORF Transcript_26161/g.32708 Transcript_26161/m.32708 type:complete len:193 (+) Transcript_26161:1938-2516(+)